MKKLSILIIVILSLIQQSCNKEYDDSFLQERITSLENRIETLEELCKQINTNISSLQTIITALQDNEYITGITPIIKDNETIGYTLTFSQSNPITIYHGKNGTDGRNGTDAPIIGVKKDANNIYYWTLTNNGITTWITDNDGKKLPVTGDKGEHGDKGENGITPKLIIKNGQWNISYDNGATWEELGKATGNDGKDGANGDSFFKDITEDWQYIYFTLSNGTEIRVRKYCTISIDIDDSNLAQIQPNSTYIIHYTLGGTDAKEQAIIKAITKDGYKSTVKESSNTTGTIELRTPEIIIPSEILVIVSDGTENTIVRSIPIGIPNNQIWYKSINKTTSVIRDPSSHFAPGYLDANILSNAYENGKGIITCDNDITIIGESTFSPLYQGGIDDLTHIIFPSSIKRIERYAFFGCNSLTDINLYNTSSVSIGESAFSGCSSLQKLVIPSSVSSIEKSAFENCSKLIELNLKEGIKNIGALAFSNCNIHTITIPNSIVTIGGGAFSGCHNLGKFEGKYASADKRYLIINGSLKSFASSGLTFKYEVPEEVKSIASYAFLNCPIRISLSNNVTDIGTGAFKGCEFSYFYIPNKVSTIEDFTFFECKNLTTIVLNNNITSIGMSAFLGCSSLSNIELPSNLSNIEMGAFEKCEKLKSISIPNNVKSINESTFQECTALENITLGKNISFIRSQAFLGCEKLSQIYCKSQTPPSITSNNCFSQYSCTVYVPIGCRDKYVNSPIWNKFANIIEKDF